MEQEQNQMKKDLAEVKVYAEAMADSDWVQDMYVDKEQDKFFYWLNRQWSNINALKECVDQSELRVRALELENKLLHWGQGVVFPPGTSQMHCKEMDKVPAKYPPRILQVHSEYSQPVSLQFSHLSGHVIFRTLYFNQFTLTS